MIIKILCAIDWDEMFTKINLLAVPEGENPDVNDIERILTNKLFDECTEGLEDLCDKLASGLESELGEYDFRWEKVELCNRSM